MLLKRRKFKRNWILAAVAAAVLLSIATVDTHDFKESIRETWEIILASDPGFSSYFAIADSPSALPPALIKRLPSILYAKVFGFPNRPEIDRLDIDIKFIKLSRCVFLPCLKRNLAVFIGNYGVQLGDLDVGCSGLGWFLDCLKLLS